MARSQAPLRPQREKRHHYVGMKESLQYKFARAVIEWLRADGELAVQLPGAAQVESLVFPEPYDSQSQNDRLNLAAAQYGAAIVVAPAGVGDGPSPEAAPWVRSLSTAVMVLTTCDVPHGLTIDGREVSAAELAASVCDHTAARLMAWLPDIEARVGERPRVSDIQPADIAREFPGHENLIAHLITIEQRFNYKDYYGNRR